jgi:Family of unknown function (DUF6221)
MSADDLVGFLKARLDEDRDYADDLAGRAGQMGPVIEGALASQLYSLMRQTALRVLREAEAKQAILDRWVKSRDDPRDIRLVAHAELEGNLALLWAVRHLAAVYSDNEEYRPEWGP